MASALLPWMTCVGQGVGVYVGRVGVGGAGDRVGHDAVGLTLQVLDAGVSVGVRVGRGVRVGIGEGDRRGTFVLWTLVLWTGVAWTTAGGGDGRVTALPRAHPQIARNVPQTRQLAASSPPTTSRSRVDVRIRPLS